MKERMRSDLSDSGDCAVGQDKGHDFSGVIRNIL